jgi:hypothetical protein
MDLPLQFHKDQTSEIKHGMDIQNQHYGSFFKKLNSKKSSSLILETTVCRNYRMQYGNPRNSTIISLFWDTFLLHSVQKAMNKETFQFFCRTIIQFSMCFLLVSVERSLQNNINMALKKKNLNCKFFENLFTK